MRRIATAPRSSTIPRRPRPKPKRAELEVEDRASFRDLRSVHRRADVLFDPAGGASGRLIGAFFVLADRNRHAAFTAAKSGVTDEPRHPADEFLDVFLALSEEVE